VIPSPGEIWFFELSERTPQGHEQTGRRPCVVVSDPVISQPLRFPMVSIVPLTTAALPSHPLYPVIPAGAGGLRRDSTALIDQLTSVDLSRTLRLVGKLSPAGMAPVVAGLRVLLRL
jgi:mRNA interferase MazF